jgi:transcriptional regulator with XRE-family HTH domain
MGRRPGNKIVPVSFDPKRVGEQITRLRKALGLTQKELAEKIGVARSSIADYERGENRIYDEMLVRLADALNRSPNEILFFKQDNFNNNQPSLRFIKRMLKIETLPENKQKFILKTIDSLIRDAESNNSQSD